MYNTSLHRVRHLNYDDLGTYNCVCTGTSLNDAAWYDYCFLEGKYAQQ